MSDRLTITRSVSALMGMAMLTACAVVPPAAPPRPPPPPPQPAPPPPPPPPVVVAPEKPWDVAALTAGDWRYEKETTGSVAFFGSTQNTDLTLRCVLPSHRIAIILAGHAGNSMTVRTSARDFTWPAFGVNAERRPAFTSVTLPASDPAFDAIAFSRGRISVEIAGMMRLILPVWAEISRVIEDCRG